MSSLIFGNSGNMPGSSNGNRHMVEFRAGRMNMVGTMLHPDLRKGLVYVYQDEGLVHFCWKDITTNVVEDDLIILPDDCEFKKVTQNKTGRVFLLKFKTSPRRLFFWMQDSKADKDDDLCRRVNESINNPPSMSNLGGGGRGADSHELQHMINNMSQQQLMQLFNGVGQIGGLSSFFGSTNRSSDSNSRSSPTSGGTPFAAAAQSANTPQAPRKVTTRRTGASDSTPASGNGGSGAARVGGTASTTPTSTDATSNDQSRILLSELRNFLSGHATDGSGSTSGGAGSGSRNIDFSAAMTSDALNPILADNPDWLEQLEEHLPNLDTDETKNQQLRDTISSPQFQQALSMFSNALQSGQLGPVMNQFKLNSDAVEAANQGDLEKFVRALEKSAKEIQAAAAASGATATKTASTAGSKEDAESKAKGGEKAEEDEDEEMAG